ncbi:acyl-CoA synthetase (AMP-forming)/AMP-acid ligase II [Breoghania corrubedonensis]|uniref:Acyl-CoA synthetase (AMP-forming)/AMP-acid ligase II n=1 Tax=Breoghania corrubedonensis TaxID=665038 RepID=A0A2T5UYM3_9HYPH|nr:AMP-binding protein [Breoghania corrubedonensis]PTW56609.1 acyl-CoA synthetase (AMP-forming)/AMP-acid ligase II [Breoghania corrubedonensis]
MTLTTGLLPELLPELLPGVLDDASVFGRFRRTAGRFPDRPFLAVLPETAQVYGIEPGEISYGAMLEAVEARAALFSQAGYGAGHRVAMLLQNRPDFLINWFALNALGVSVVPINPDLRSAELEYLIGHSEAALVVAIPERVAELAAAAEAAGTGSGSIAHVITPHDLIPAPPRPAANRDAAPDRATECALLYTSGTTGRPKGCVLANDYFLLAGEWYATVGDLCALHVEPAERMLTPLPVFHMNAMAYSVMAMMTVGGSICILDRFHPRSWWASVRGFGATVIHYLGVMPAMLMSAPPSPADRDHKVRFGFGAGVDRTLHAPFEERFGFPLLEAWAMTETGAGAVVIASTEPRKIGTSCFGKPGPEMDIAIRREDGSEAGTDEPGELLVRWAGPDPKRGFFREYLKDAEATAAAWAGGYLNTGDVVSRDADGRFHFIDRKKNVIRRSGENISAVEVEAVLVTHPGVRQVAVAPTPDPVRGDEVVALVVPENPPADEAAARRLAEDIVRFCLSRLAYYKAPGFVAFVSSIPLTSTEKIQRGALKIAVEEAIASGRALDTCAMKKRTA